MRSPTQDPNPARLGLFWLGIQMVWGALLGVSLQARASQLVAHNPIAAYGALAIVGASAAAITQIVTGILSDRRRLLGSKRVEFYAGGAIAGAIALIWFYSAPVFAQLIGATICVQIAMNVAIGPYQAVIPDFVTEERLGTASSWMAALQSAGNALGALTAGLIANGRIVALTLASVLLLTCAATASHVRRFALLPAQEQALRISRAFIDLFVSRALVYIGFYTLLGYLYFYVARTMAGNTKTMTGIVLLVFTVSGVLGALAAAGPSNRLDRRLVASAGGAGFVLAIFAFLLSHAISGVVVSATIAGVAWGVFLTADWVLGCHFLPRQALATAMGIWNLALLIPQIVAPLIVSGVVVLLHALQSGSAPRIAFMLAALEVCAGVAWIWRLPAFSAIEPAPEGNTP